jgi:hypothetical protein
MADEPIAYDARHTFGGNMTRLSFSSAVFVAFVCVAGLSQAGCGGSDASSAGAGPQVSALEREARDTAMAEVQKRWKKDPDGFTTARVAGTSFAPDRYLRQVRDIAVTGVESYDLAESDKLNGFEWAGAVKFKELSAREAGDPGVAFEGLAGISLNRNRGQWTQWVEYQPEAIVVQKVKGKWQTHDDTWLLRGSMPTAADYANAGVK